MADYIEKAISYFTDKGVTRGVAITYLVVGALLAIMAIVVVVMRIVLIVKYQNANKVRTASGKTNVEIAREALNKAGLKDVQIKKAGFFRAFFIGNSYSTRKKIIYLRRGIYGQSTVTAIGVAMQKVGLAKILNEGDKKIVVRNAAMMMGLIGPVLFVPLVILGAVIDYLLFGVFGTFSIVCICIGMLFIVLSFLETLLNLPVEKKANNRAMKMVEDYNLLNEEERFLLKKVFDAYMISYVCEFIVSVLRLVQLVLEIVMNIQISNSGKE